jgi:beta-lactamase regulating signal transducer with metallopeptidase domain
MTLRDLDRVSDALFVWTWKTSLQATVLIAVVLTFQLLFRRWLTPLLRYALGVLVLVRLLLPEVPASHFSIFNLKPAWVRPSAEKDLLPVPSSDPLPSLPSISGEVGVVLERERTPVTPRSPWRLTLIAKGVWMTGCVALLFRVFRQQRELSLWMKNQPATTDARLTGLLEDCKKVMKVSRKIRLYKTRELKTPAVFRFWKPCLLVPEDICDRLDDSELKMIFLHELAHIKRGDVLTNWLIIVVRSLHWFNPAVWLAMRRLRADQELVCDARTMAQLGVQERQLYGNTLLKLMIDLSQARLCPSLLPVITNKQETKRRIIMISKFKPARRATVVLSAAIVVAVCSFTFTRAAEKNPSGEKAVSVGVSKEPNLSGLKTLAEQLRMEERSVREAQKEMDKLRAELGISDAALDLQTLKPETVRKLEGVKIESQSMFTRYITLYNKLRSLPEEQLVKALPRAYPDAILSELLIRKLQVERELTASLKQYTPEHPDVIRLQATLEKVDSQVRDALEGVLRGLKAQIDAAEAQYKEADRLLAEAKANDILKSKEYGPYFAKKRLLETHERMFEILKMKTFQEMIDILAPEESEKESK